MDIITRHGTPQTTMLTVTAVANMTSTNISGYINTRNTDLSHVLPREVRGFSVPTPTEVREFSGPRHESLPGGPWTCIDIKQPSTTSAAPPLTLQQTACACAAPLARRSYAQGAATSTCVARANHALQEGDVC